MKNSSGGFGLFLLGTAVGAALGILLAPDAGEETRTALADKAKDAWDQVKDKVSEGEDKLNQYKEEAKSYKDQLVSEAKSKVKEKADDLNDKVQNA